MDNPVSLDLYSLLNEIDVNETEFKAMFREFILTFNPTSETNRPKKSSRNEWDEEIFDVVVDEEDGRNGPPKTSYYLHLLHKAVEDLALRSGDNALRTDADISPYFMLNLFHLQSASSRLYSTVIQRPADSIVFMDEVLSDFAQSEYADMGVKDIPLKIALFHNPHIYSMRDLDPQHIETLITIRAIVIRCSSVIPEMRVAVFRCTSRKTNSTLPVTSTMIANADPCDHQETVPLINGEVQEPLHCVKCNSKYSFELVHAQCTFGNKQLLKVQETPEHIPEGETPHTVMAYVFDELVDAAKPGDFVEITGIYKASGVRVIPRMRSLKSVYRTYIDVNSIHKDHLNRFLISPKNLEGPEYEEQSVEEACHDKGDEQFPAEHREAPQTFIWTPQMVSKMKLIGKDPNVYNHLVYSIAPNIWECDDVKKGLLCQLFGGTPKKIGDRSSRSDIHLLLCGDPSTAKSQLLKYVHGLAPRGVYTCGRGSSAVGLTASVVRDTETKDFILESGAIVLSDSFKIFF